MLLNVLLAPKASPCGVWEVVKSTTKSTTCSTFGTQTSLSCVRGASPVGLRAGLVPRRGTRRVVEPSALASGRRPGERRPSTPQVPPPPVYPPGGGAFWQISNKGNSGPARRIAVTETVSEEARPESKEASARTRARTAAPRATWDDGTLGHRFEWAPQFRSARA